MLVIFLYQKEVVTVLKNILLPNPSGETLDGSPNVRPVAKSNLSRIIDSNDMKQDREWQAPCPKQPLNGGSHDVL